MQDTSSPLIPRHGRLWLLLGLSVSAAFFILGFFGREVYRQAPPIPLEVRAADGRVVMTHDGALTGQTVWQSTGGQQLGSIWGHGAYQAPDWTADWLHREATTLLDLWSTREHGASYAELDVERQAALRARLKKELRTNTFDASTGVATISPDRAEAIARVARHYDDLFGGAAALDQLRDDYAMHDVVVPDAGRRATLTQFFFWTSWASATNRPGRDITYTNNWPHEPLIDNVPSAGNVLWSIISVVLLLAGVGAIAWRMAFTTEPEAASEAPVSDPFTGLTLTPSMRAIAKYVAVVVALFVVQVLLGALTAHYTV
jgi:nitric oxide reductase subunit B